MKRRSAFKLVKASKTREGIKRGKPQSKGKRPTRRHAAIYPGGESRLSRSKHLVHPVGVRGHVPRNRSVKKIARRTKNSCGHSFTVFVFPPDPPDIDPDEDAECSLRYIYRHVHYRYHHIKYYNDVIGTHTFTYTDIHFVVH